MSRARLYPFLASVTTRSRSGAYRHPAGAWRVALRTELAGRGYDLRGDGVLEHRARPIGVYSTLEVDEVAHLFRGAPWLDPGECPFSGVPIGFLNWNFRFQGPWSPDDGRLELPAALAAAGSSVLARAADHRYTRAARRRRVALSVLLDRGALAPALLSREPDYLADVVYRIRAVLAAAGLEAELRVDPRAPDPIRIDRVDAPPLFRALGCAFRWGERLRPALYEDRREGRVLVAHPRRVLSALEVELWSPDPSFHDDLF